MPSSTKPNRPFRGNKFLISSKEYQELSTRLFQVVEQLRQVQAVLQVFINAAATQVAAEEATALPVDRVFESSMSTIPKEVWDEYEKDMDANAALAESMAPQEAV